MAVNRRVLLGIALTVAIATTVQVNAQLITLDQGSTRSVSTTSASVTSISGVPAFISATTQRPFVMGLIPVVGDYGGAYAPIYGPASLMPQYNPGPSVVADRIARMRQEGIPFLTGRREASSKAAPSAVANQTKSDSRARLAAARESSAGRAAESIAAIRRRQQQEFIGNREVVDSGRNAYHAESAGKPPTMILSAGK